MDRLWENHFNLPGQNGPTRKTPAVLAANQPMARAIRWVVERRKSQTEFAEELRAIGVPVNDHHQVSGWVLGASPETWANSSTIPAYVLLGAATVAGLTVGELLTMAGVEGQEPIIDQLKRFRRRQEMLEEAVNQILSDAGLPTLPVIDDEALD